MKKPPRKMKKLGFVIANNAEEYLHNYDFKDDRSMLAWVGLPDFARVFATYQHAQAVFKRTGRSDLWVLSLFETPKTSETLGCYLVTTGSTNKPEWLY